MWAAVLVLALMAASDPVRLGVVLLLISRPRPIPNLFMYWLGALVIGIIIVLIFLVGMRGLLPAMVHKLAVMTAKPTVQYAEVIIGLLALPLAVSIAAGFSRHQRSQANIHVPREAASVLTLRRGAPKTVGLVARLMGRAQTALKSGSPWIALVVGLGSGPPPAECLGAFVAIFASGASVKTQATAGVIFVVIMLVAFEVTLISHLLIPTQTQAIVVRAHDWLRNHRHHIFALIIAALGIGLMANGIGGG